MINLDLFREDKLGCLQCHTTAKLNRLSGSTLDIGSFFKHCRTTAHNSAISRDSSLYHAVGKIFWNPRAKAFTWQAVAFDPKVTGQVFPVSVYHPPTPAGSKRLRRESSDTATTLQVRRL